jgi:hypothetical protein
LVDGRGNQDLGYEIEMSTLTQAIPAFMFSCEKITYWFFRLNGCLNLTNFLIHHEMTNREGTEVDVLGVRFPERNELALSGHAMDDFQLFKEREKRIDIIIADSKKGLCSINDSWLKPELRNMERILYVLGIFPQDAVENIARKFYERYCFDEGGCRVQYYVLGAKKNEKLSPTIIQLTWEEVLTFIHQRFITFEDYKRQHDQWDDTGKELFKVANQNRRDSESFVGYVTSRLTK